MYSIHSFPTRLTISFVISYYLFYLLVHGALGCRVPTPMAKAAASWTPVAVPLVCNRELLPQTRSERCWRLPTQSIATKIIPRASFVSWSNSEQDEQVQSLYILWLSQHYGGSLIFTSWKLLGTNEGSEQTHFEREKQKNKLTDFHQTVKYKAKPFSRTRHWTDWACFPDCFNINITHWNLSPRNSNALFEYIADKLQTNGRVRWCYMHTWNKKTSLQLERHHWPQRGSSTPGSVIASHSSPRKQHPQRTQSHCCCVFFFGSLRGKTW